MYHCTILFAFLKHIFKTKNEIYMSVVYLESISNQQKLFVLFKLISEIEDFKLMLEILTHGHAISYQLS